MTQQLLQRGVNVLRKTNNKVNFFEERSDIEEPARSVDYVIEIANSQHLSLLAHVTPIAFCRASPADCNLSAVTIYVY